MTVNIRQVLILFVFASLPPFLAAQRSLILNAQEQALPDAPQSQVAGTPSGEGKSEANVGSIEGTVLDKNQNPLPAAQITLTGPSGSVVRTLQSGDNGQFSIAGLAPDTYKVTVSARGMSSYTSSQISLNPGEFRIMPPIILSLASVATSVTVTDNK